MEIKKMFEDLYRIWKKTGILKRRGAKLSRLWRRNGRKIVRLWRRNGRKIKGIWKTRGTKLRRMHLEKLNFDVNRWIQCFEQLGVINGR